MLSKEGMLVMQQLTILEDDFCFVGEAKFNGEIQCSTKFINEVGKHVVEPALALIREKVALYGGIGSWQLIQYLDLVFNVLDYHEIVEFNTVDEFPPEDAFEEED